MKSNKSRRKLLRSMGVSAGLSLSVISGSSAARRSTDGSDSADSRQLETEFDPHELDEVERFVRGFYELDEDHRDRLSKQLTRDQKQAVVDVQLPVEYTVREQIGTGSKTNSPSIHRATETTYAVDRGFEKKWGWSTERVSDRADGTTRVVYGEEDGAVRAASSGCDSPKSHFFHSEVDAHSTLGFLVFTFEHEVDWETKWIGSNEFNCTPDGIIGYDVRSRGQGEDFAWNYDGLVDSWVNDSSDERMVSYRQGRFSGPSVGGVGFNADPYIELEFEDYGGGGVIDKDNGT